MNPPTSSSSSSSLFPSLTKHDDKNQEHLSEQILQYIDKINDKNGLSIIPSSSSPSLSSTVVPNNTLVVPSSSTTTTATNHLPQTSSDLVPFTLIGNIHTGLIGSSLSPSGIFGSSSSSFRSNRDVNDGDNSTTTTMKGIVTSRQDKALEHIMDTLTESSTIVPSVSPCIPSSTVLLPVTSSSSSSSTSTIHSTLIADQNGDKKYMEHLLDILDYETTIEDIQYAEQIGTDSSTVELMKNHLNVSSSSSSPDKLTPTTEAKP